MGFGTMGREMSVPPEPACSLQMGLRDATGKARLFLQNPRKQECELESGFIPLCSEGLATCEGFLLQCVLR